MSKSKSKDAKTKKKEEGRGPGQPTSYRPEYCEELIIHMSGGKSLESFAGVVGCHRDTIYAWRDANPEFSDAIKKGKDQSLLFWENLGIAGAAGKLKGFNAASFIFNMKNRFGWRNNVDITSAGKRLDGAPPVAVQVILPHNRRFQSAKTQSNAVDNGNKPDSDIQKPKEE